MNHAPHIVTPPAIAMIVLAGVAVAGSSIDWPIVHPLLSCEGAGPDTYYFPAGLLDPADGPRSRAGWYDSSLLAMHEPSLSCGAATADETYRFVWLRSFNAPIAVRVSRAGEAVHLVAVTLSGRGGYDPGHEVARVEKSLSRGEWDRLKAALDRLGFWTMTPATGGASLDGAVWLLEGRAADYHLVDRRGDEEGVRDVGLLMLSLAGITVPPKDIY